MTEDSEVQIRFTSGFASGSAPVRVWYAHYGIVAASLCIGVANMVVVEECHCRGMFVSG